MDNGLEYRLCVALAEALSVRKVLSEDDFFDLGGDSLSAIRFFEFIEREFDVSLPVSTLLERSTVRDIAELVREGGRETIISRMYRYKRGDSSIKFFCAHGNLSHLFPYLREEQGVYVLTPHGLDGNLIPDNVSAMAADYLAEIQAVQERGPYFLGGYSFGGLIILEVATRLLELGHQVAFLGIFDTLFKRIVERDVSSQLARLDEIESHAHTHGRVPQALRMRYFPLAFTRAKLKYCPDAYAGSMTYFKAVENPRTDGYYTGGNDLVLDDFSVHEVGGDHATMLEEPHVRRLASLLQQCLDQASRDLLPVKVRRSG